MTAPAQVQSIIVTKIFEHYRMLQSDIDALASQLTAQITRTYRETINQQLRLYSCQKFATGPDTQASKWIESKALKDSEGIAQTYDRELKNHIARLRDRAPRGNRFYYLKALDEWIATRNAHKVPSIALNTMTSAREYAAQRFRTENGIEGKFIFAGPPPVCKKCIRLKAKGLVSAKQAKEYGDSQHPGCPHRWNAVTLGKLDCDTAWTG